MELTKKEKGQDQGLILIAQEEDGIHQTRMEDTKGKKEPTDTLKKKITTKKRVKALDQVVNQHTLKLTLRRNMNGKLTLTLSGQRNLNITGIRLQRQIKRT